MPRDDLSIDFVKMPSSAEPMDPGLLLDDWIHRTSNLHEEIRFLQDEIRDKDIACNECVRNFEESDAKIQRWIRANGSAQPNPREDLLRANIRENFAKAEDLTKEKLVLSNKLQALFDKHLRQLDGHIKLLYDKEEPGFMDPDELPSVLRPSAANHSIPSTKYPAVAAASPLHPLSTITNNATPTTTKAPASLPNNAAAVRPNKPPPSKPLIRNLQQSQLHNSNSAPATPAATTVLKTKERESSVGPSRPKAGTPKAGTPAATARAGSAGPRTTVKAAAVRKSTTTHLPQKRPAPPRDSDDDASGSDDEEDDEEGKKYCLCQHVSYGDMVACDNPKCPYEWFHWQCVGLKSEPQGRWYCPECSSEK